MNVSTYQVALNKIDKEHRLNRFDDNKKGDEKREASHHMTVYVQLSCVLNGNDSGPRYIYNNLYN